MERTWIFQETSLEWNMWGFGIKTWQGRGWDRDERIIYFGPLRFYYVNTSGWAGD